METSELENKKKVIDALDNGGLWRRFVFIQNKTKIRTPDLRLILGQLIEDGIIGSADMNGEDVTYLLHTNPYRDVAENKILNALATVEWKPLSEVQRLTDLPSEDLTRDIKRLMFQGKVNQYYFPEESGYRFRLSEQSATDFHYDKELVKSVLSYVNWFGLSEIQRGTNLSDENLIRAINELESQKKIEKMHFVNEGRFKYRLINEVPDHGMNHSVKREWINDVQRVRMLFKNMDTVWTEKEIATIIAEPLDYVRLILDKLESENVIETASFAGGYRSNIVAEVKHRLNA